MKIKANLLNKPVNFQMDDCQIEKVVELPRDQFSALVITPLTNQPFIAENKRWMFADNSAVHCLLALGQGSDDGVLIYSGGYDYPRLAAYLPGMRDILNARLERAADFIVHQGTEATENGSWSISCEELEKQTGITVRRGNGLDGMLLEALMRRSEVASVSMTDTGIDMAYHLNFCPRIPGQKPCYFTKLPEEQKTQVFYEAVEVLLDFFGDENLYGVLHNGLQKDWNEDVKARCGLEAQSAEEHPQLMAAPEVCKRVCAMSTAVKLDRLNAEVPRLIEQYRSHLHWGRFDQAMDCMEQASALAAAACRRELRQLGMAATEEEVAGALCERIRPHRNRGSLKNRYRVLAPQFQSVLALEDAAGLRTQEEKKTLAGRWLDLAAAFAGVPIQYEAEQMKQREAQSTLNMELGVTL